MCEQRVFQWRAPDEKKRTPCRFHPIYLGPAFKWKCISSRVEALWLVFTMHNKADAFLVKVSYLSLAEWCACVTTLILTLFQCKQGQQILIATQYIISKKYFAIKILLPCIFRVDEVKRMECIFQWKLISEIPFLRSQFFVDGDRKKPNYKRVFGFSTGSMKLCLKIFKFCNLYQHFRKF